MDSSTQPDQIKSTDELFMDIIHNYRLAWDRGCTDFKDRNKKENSWVKIAEEAKMTVQQATTKYHWLN